MLPASVKWAGVSHPELPAQSGAGGQERPGIRVGSFNRTLCQL